MGNDHNASGAPQHFEVEMPQGCEKHNHQPQGRQISCSSTCSFSNNNNNDFDRAERSRSTTKLQNLIIFYIVVMVVEIIGGIKSNSLGVLTDAAHLLSDIAGFSISLFAVWVSGWEATKRQSFGFHRLEVLGALLSVQLIWLISGVLLYEAIDRLLRQTKKVNGKLMFGIAAFGFIINLIMVLWLGHDHHSHHACSGEDHNHDIEKPTEGHGHSHHACSGEDHNHDIEKPTEGHGHSHHACSGEDHNHDIEKPTEGHGHSHHARSGEDHNHDIEKPTEGHGHSHHACSGEDHNHDTEEPTENNDEKTSFLESIPRHGSQHSNINIQGAYLHVMTDMIQSVGVMFAGGIIWLKPEWLVVDLICTLVFSVFALITTFPMLKSIFSILTERTPSSIDIDHLENGIRSIKGVDDVHDLHVWAITTGKFVLTCHVVIEPGVAPAEMLQEIKYYCEQTFRIHHVTVEIEQKQ